MKNRCLSAVTPWSGDRRQEFRALFHSQLDISGDLVAVHTGDEGTHLGAGLCAIGDLELGDARSHACEQGLSGAVSHRNGD